MKKGFQHFMPVRIIKKSFTASSKLNYRETSSTYIKSQLEYKQLYFKYNNIEFKSQIPKKPSQSIREFLENFANERSTNTKQFTSRDFEVFRGQKYLNLSQTINELETSPNEKDPLTFLDSTLTLSNIKYRGLKHLSNPFTDSSQTLQTYLNSFLDKIPANMDKVNKESIMSNLRSFNSLEGNKSKTVLVIIAILNQLQNVFPDKNIKLEFKLNYKLDLSKYNKNNIEDVFIIRNLNNDVHIPVNVLSQVNEESDRVNKFDQEIINNMDVLRKLAIKNNTTMNFGIITDFHNWKINLYHKPKDDFVEKQSDYLTSLKYNLSASAADFSTNSLSIILRVLAGILTIDQKEVTKRMSA